MKLFKNMLFIILCAVVFLVVLFISFLISSQKIILRSYAPLQVEWNDTVGTAYLDIAYGDGQYQNYDLYVPATPNENERYSLILFIHGGGFTGGDKAEGERWGKYFASKGYICASINYTIHTEQTQSDLKTMYQETRTAVDHIYSEAKGFGYNITEMAVTGVSAGGCLALMYAYNPPENAPIPVKLVFEQVGPVSFEPAAWSNNTPEQSAAFASFMTGEEITAEMIKNGEYKPYIDEISPVSYVNKDTVPTILGYGVRDGAVPPSLKFMLIDALEQNGVPYEYIEFSNSGHGLLNDPDKTEAYIDTVNEYLELYFENK